MVAIAYTLFIDGTPADAAITEAIREIEVEDHARLAGILRLRLGVAVDPSGSAWAVVDEDVFPRLANVKLLVTIGSALPETLIDAYVIETSVEFSNSPGHSVLTVVAMDATVLMNLEEKVREWPNLADSDVATLVFAEHGLIPDVEATTPIRTMDDVTLIQRGSDIAFLRHLARRNGYECYVEPNALTGLPEGHFHPPRLDETPQGVLAVNMGEATNVDRFAARHDMLRATAVEVAGVDAGGVAEQSATADGVSLTLLGNDSTLADEDARKVLPARSGLMETGELATFAQAVVDRAAWAVTAEGEVATATYGAILRARRTILVRGVGTTFGGTYYVERVLHRITGDAYTQSFTLTRNALGLTGMETFAVLAATSAI